MTHQKDPVEKKVSQFSKRIKHYYRIFKKIIWGFLVVILGALAYKMVPFIYFSTRSIPPIPVSTTLTKSDVWNEEIHVIGSVVAVNAVTVSTELGGMVTKILFNPGDMVKEGDPILIINDEVEQAELKRSKAQLDLSEVTLSRSQKLSKTDVESKANRDRKESEYEEALALVAQAQAVIDKKNIKAPFTGQLGIRQVNLGQYINAGTAIVTLTDLDNLYVDFMVPERFQKVLAEGQKIRFKVEAYPDKEFEAEITTIEPQINENTRNVMAQATYKNKDHLLTPGMFADIFVILPKTDPVIVVPETALDFGLYGTAIYVVNEENPDHLTVKRVFVEAGDRRHGDVAVLKGLEDGQRIVTAGQLKLDNGAYVVLSDDPGPSIPDHLTLE